MSFAGMTCVGVLFARILLRAQWHKATGTRLSFTDAGRLTKYAFQCKEEKRSQYPTDRQGDDP